MSLRIVVDVCLSPEWVAKLAGHGWDTVHWSAVGDPHAEDAAIMAWARANDRVVFTHDLDFGAALALTQATGPSVLQLRTQRVLPEDAAPLVFSALRQFESELVAGAVVVVDEKKRRVRVLPI